MKDLERNIVASDPILTAGPYSFKILVAWSLGRDGSVQDHSMLGIALDRTDTHSVNPIMMFEVRLINKSSARTISHSCTLPVVFRHGEFQGWYPSPHALKREPQDGFVRLESILDVQEGWLVDDILVVECDVTCTVSGVEPVQSFCPQRADALQDLGQQLGGLLDEGHLADVIVRVGDEKTGYEKIRAHSSILAARSPVFKAMWSTSMREQAKGEVVISGLDPSAVRRMIRFMYTGAFESKVEKDTDTITLLEAAHQYEVSALVELCVGALSARLTVQSVAETLMVADLTGIEHLRQECLRFITNSTLRTAEVQGTDGFSSLKQKRPHLIAEVLAAAIPPAEGKVMTDPG